MDEDEPQEPPSLLICQKSLALFTPDSLLCPLSVVKRLFRHCLDFRTSFSELGKNWFLTCCSLFAVDSDEEVVVPSMKPLPGEPVHQDKRLNWNHKVRAEKNQNVARLVLIDTR